MADEMLNLSQACEIMRVSYSTGQKLAKAGTLPFKKLGSSWRIPRSALYRELGMERDDKQVKEKEEACV